MDAVDRVRAAHPDKRVEIFFEDEARFGQQGTLTRVWARTGSRPTAVRQTQYDYLWVLTAASAESGQSVGLISPTLNAKVINLFLTQMSAEFGPDVHAVLIWDGAGFHTAGAVDVPANITLLRLPPYSPELKCDREPVALPAEPPLVEPVLPRLRRVFDAATAAWRAVCLDDELIKTVCAAPYLQKRAD